MRLLLGKPRKQAQGQTVIIKSDMVKILYFEQLQAYLGDIANTCTIFMGHEAKD